MNRVFRHIWSRRLGRVVVVAECLPGAGGGKAGRRARRLAGVVVALPGLLAAPAFADDLPTGGQIVHGQATISQSGNAMTIDQSSRQMIANWQDFSIGAGASVTFNQPDAGSTALNRVVGQDPSRILGSLDANGQVFLVNPNGIVFGRDSRVRTGAFVGSTLGISDEDFVAGKYRFAGETGRIDNLGRIEGGVVALISPTVTNEGEIAGDTALAAGTGVSLDFDGDGLISIEVGASTVETLVDNRGLVKADGGTAILTARGASDALAGVVNNSGTVQARTLKKSKGRILLLGDMDNGAARVSGRLDASAPDGGGGGFIETSAASVKVADEAVITTMSADGDTGTWLIDPKDFTVAAAGGDITGAALSAQLAGNNVRIESVSGASDGNGDIFVIDSISWSQHTLTLAAERGIVIGAELFGSGTAGLALEYGLGAPAAGNTAGYVVDAPVNLASTGSFSTKLGSDGATIGYTIVTHLGNESSSGDGTLQGIRGNLAGNYVLGSDIDASATSGWNSDGGGHYGFAPLGTNSPAFTGILDGLGHEIGNLYINRPGEDSVGLVGYTRTGAVVRNLGVVGADITGQHSVGAVVGTATTSARFSGLWSSGQVHAANGYVGGLIGMMQAYGPMSLTDSRSSAAVSGTYYVGGLVGYANAGTNGSLVLENLGATGSATASGNGGGAFGTVDAYNGSEVRIRNTYSTASVAGGTGYQGGFAGQIYAHSGDISIADSYAAGPVSGSSSLQAGMVGYFSAYTGAATISSSFWDAAATGKSNFGGYVDTQEEGVGFIDPSGASSLSSAEATDPFTFIEAGWDFDTVWGKSTTGENGGYMMLRRQGGTLYDGYLRIAGNLERDYGQANPGLGGVILSAGSVAVDWASTIHSLTDVGSYALADPGALTIMQTGSLYSDVAGAGNLVIDKAALTVSSGDVTKTYDGTVAAAGTAVVTGGTLYGTGTLAGGAFAFDTADAGTGKTVTVSGVTVNDGNGGNNYAVTYAANTNSTIDKAALTVTANDAGKTYDGVAYSGGNGVAYSGFVAGEGEGDLGGALVFGGSAQGVVNAGSYAIAASGLASGNYDIAYVDGTLTIGKAALTVTASNADKTYDGVAYSGGNGVAYSGFVAGEDEDDLGGALVFGGSAQGAVNAGSYAIAASGLTSGNYDIAYVDGTLAVDKAALTVSSGDVTKTYDGTVAAVGTAVVTGGALYGTDTLAGGAFAFDTADAGTGKTVTVSGVTVNDGNGGNNYAVTHAANTSSTIDKAALTITANDAGKTYDRLAYSGGNGVAYSGFVAGDDESDLGGALAFGGSAQGAVNAGSYAIAASGLASGNYDIAYVDGTLTVDRAAIGSIGGIAALDKPYDGSTDATLDFSGAVFNGLLAGDSLAVGGTPLGSFADANPGLGRTVNITGLGLAGVDAANYVLVDATALATADITSSQNTDPRGVDPVSPPAGGAPSPVGGGFEAVPAVIIVSSLPGPVDPGQGVSARLDRPGFEPMTVRLYLTGDTLVVVVPDEAAMQTEFDGEVLRRLAEETLGPEAAGITAIRVVVADNA